MLKFKFSGSLIMAGSFSNLSDTVLMDRQSSELSRNFLKFFPERKVVPGEVALFDANNVEECPWPQTNDGQYARAFLTPLIQRGVSSYIENVRTDMRALVLEDLVLPITINDAEYENSYICSPYSFFITYAKNSLDILSQAWLRQCTDFVLGGFGRGLRQMQINKVVVVNNWLTSTNLYPRIKPDQLTKIADFLLQTFPEHALIFRCVDPVTSPVCYETLRHSDFEYIATRPIFFLDPATTTFFESRLFKSDLKLLKNSGYEVVRGDRIDEREIPRLIELYREVYIHKYSNLNPNFHPDFIRLALNQKLLEFLILKRGGRIDGVVGYLQRDGKMYCPFFGYDLNVPKEEALYRLLSTVLMLEARERNLFFHQSSGASAFKKMRKAGSTIEYTAVFYKHLKKRRHLPWIMLKHFYNSIGAFYMKRY